MENGGYIGIIQIHMFQIGFTGCKGLKKNIIHKIDI